MRHRVEVGTCPCCRNDDILRGICSVCRGEGRAVIVHLPGYEVELYPVADEAAVRERYPDEPTPVHERTTVAQAWERFVDAVEIRHARPAQLREMRRAFYAGAWWLLEVASIQMDPDAVATADDIEYLQRVSDEMQRFNQDIQEGRA